MLQGAIMDMPLMISSAIEHAAAFHGGTPIIARDVDGTIHRYTYADAHRRTKRLAKALGRLGRKSGRGFYQYDASGAKLGASSRRTEARS